MTGQRGAAADTASIPGQRRPEPERPHFDMVLRGYDRIEVDEYIEKLLEENAELRRELDERRPPASPPSPSGPRPREEPAPQHYDVDTPAEDSFGFRAEKLLRLAEREAAEMRTRATRDAEGVEATARRRAEEQLRAAEREADEIRAQAVQRGRPAQEAGHPGGGAGQPPAPDHEGGAPAAGGPAERRAGAPRPRGRRPRPARRRRARRPRDPGTVASNP